MTTQKVRRLRYRKPEPVIICDGKRPGEKVVCIGGKWHKAKPTANGWKMAGRTGEDLRELASEVGNV